MAKGDEPESKLELIKVSKYHQNVFEITFMIKSEIKKKLNSSMTWKKKKKAEKYNDILMKILNALSKNLRHYLKEFPAPNFDYYQRLGKLLQNTQKLDPIDKFDSRIYFSIDEDLLDFRPEGRYSCKFFTLGALERP